MALFRPEGISHRLIAPIMSFSVAIKILVIVTCGLAIFYPDLYVIGSEAIGSDYYNYILVLPFLSAYLVYRKRSVLSVVMPIKDEDARGHTNLVVGICSLAIALIFYLYGAFASDPLDYHLIAFEVFMIASVLLLFNRRTAQVLVPPILMGLAALPAAVLFGLGWWQDFSSAGATYSYDILSLFNYPVTLGSVVTVPALQLTTPQGTVYSFVVGVASSGIYSVVGFTIFAAFVAFIAKGRAWKKVLLFLLGFPLLLLINIFRMAVLVVATYYWGFAAFEIFHATTGIILVFIVTFLLLVIGDRFFGLSLFDFRITSKFCQRCSDELKKSRDFCENCGRFFGIIRVGLNKRDAVSIAALILVVILFLSSLLPAVVRASSPTNVILSSITIQSAMTFLPAIPHWNLTFLGRDTQIEQVLDQDAALIYEYTSTNVSQSDNLTTPVFEVAVQISSGIHTPEDSIVVAPSFIGLTNNKVLEDSDVQILGNPFLVGKFFVFQQQSDPNHTQTFLYWNLASAFNFGSYYAFRNVQISVVSAMENMVNEGLIPNTNDLQAAEQVSLSIARQIASFWQPIGTNSYLQLTVRQWYLPLLGTAIFPAAIVVGNGIYEKKKSTKSSEEELKKISSIRDKQLLKAVVLSGKKNQTLESILEQYATLTGTKITPAAGLLALASAERLGFVRHRIIDLENQPRMVWEVAFPQ